MAKQTFRVVIPTNPEQRLNLAELVLQKHTTDGTSSPLNTLVDHSWTVNGPKVAQARAKQDSITQLEKDLETMYKERNLLLDGVMNSVKASRDLLIGVYKTNPKKLGDWGFEVNDTPPRKKKGDAPAPPTPPADPRP
jgi:hypothetical protein